MIRAKRYSHYIDFEQSFLSMVCKLPCRSLADSVWCGSLWPTVWSINVCLFLPQWLFAPLTLVISTPSKISGMFQGWHEYVEGQTAPEGMIDTWINWETGLGTFGWFMGFVSMSQAVSSAPFALNIMLLTCDRYMYRLCVLMLIFIYIWTS